MPDTAPATLSDFYAASLDAALATFGSDDARRVYLKGQQITWQYRWQRFLETGKPHAVHPQYGSPSEISYANIVSAIELRQAKYAEAVPA